MGKSPCKTPYILGRDVIHGMPEIVPSTRRSTPSHVQLCQAFLDQTKEERSTLSRKTIVQEDPDLCLDWAEPHASLMEMFASSLIAAFGKSVGLDLSYNHKCHLQLPETHASKTLHFDFSPAQVVLPEDLVSSNDAAKVDQDLLSDLCRECIHEYEAPRSESSGVEQETHHCLLFPDSDKAEAIVEKSKSNLLPLAAILPSIVDRLRHLSWDWLHTTDPIELEDESGVIVYLDESSTYLSYDSYDHIISEATANKPTSIQILISANCALSQINQQSNCVEHGRRLKRHFLQTLTLTKGVYVRIDIVASTAASFSRMLHTKLLICPPGTVGCLLPALAKNPNTKVYIAEHPDRPSTRHWYDYLLEEHKKTRVVSATAPNEVLKEEARMNAFDLEILDNVDLTMPLELVVDGLTEEEEDSILNDLVEKGEFVFDENRVSSPISDFGHSPLEQENVIMEIPLPIKSK